MVLQTPTRVRTDAARPVNDPDFHLLILFTDEASFSLNEIWTVNLWNRKTYTVGLLFGAHVKLLDNADKTETVEAVGAGIWHFITDLVAQFI